MAASRMNTALFLHYVDKMNSIVENENILRNTHTIALPLMNLAEKIILSNLPPFFIDDLAGLYS